MIALDNNYDYKIKYLVKINNFSSVAIFLKIALSYSVNKNYRYTKNNYNSLGFKINEVTLLGDDYLIYKNIIEEINDEFYQDKEFIKKILPNYIYKGIDYFFEEDRKTKRSMRKVINDELLR